MRVDMASLSIEKPAVLQTDAARSRSDEDMERIERFLHLINRSHLNIKRSMTVIDGGRTLSHRNF